MAILQCVVKGAMSGEPWENNFFFFVDTVPIDLFQTATDSLRAAYALLAPTHTNDWEMQNVDCRIVDGSGTPYITKTPTSGIVAGASTAENLPATQAIVPFSRAMSESPNKSWLFLNGYAEDHNGVSGVPTAGVLEDVVDFVDYLLSITSFSTAAAAWVTARLGGSPQDVLAYNHLISSTVSGIWKWLRSREF